MGFVVTSNITIYFLKYDTCVGLNPYPTIKIILDLIEPTNIPLVPCTGKQPCHKNNFNQKYIPASGYTFDFNDVNAIF